MDYNSVLEIGDAAPYFALPNQHGRLVGLDDYDGAWVVVWWLPSTLVQHASGCGDRIAVGFARHLAEHPELNVVGLSFDTQEQAREFARRGSIEFPMLSALKQTGIDYGVYRGDEDEWNCFPRKRAFLVAPDGHIAKVYLNIDPDLFVHEVLTDLEELAPKRRSSVFGRVLSSLKG
jgi:peroxiredoxin Q/BCP